MSARNREKFTPSPLSMRTHHKFRKIRRFLRQTVRRPHLKNPPCQQNARIGQPPLTADIFYGQPHNMIHDRCYFKQPISCYHL